MSAQDGLDDKTQCDPSSTRQLGTYEIRTGFMSVTWSVFAGYSGFRHQLQLASHDFVAIWQKKVTNVIGIRRYVAGEVNPLVSAESPTIMA